MRFKQPLKPPYLKYLSSLGILLFLMLLAQYAQAQGCVQCRMAPESDMRNGGTAATGLNTAILYLMAIPYLLLLAIVGYVFRKQLQSYVEKLKRRLSRS